MADVPKEALEFARMAVRAFYPVEFAVVADGVLRRNNLVSHAELAAQLRMGPKDLRQIMSRMEGARLMKKEGIQQKRINYKDERHPTRVVQTQFWHMPLSELIDAFQFRISVIEKDVEDRIRKEKEKDVYTCTGCKRKYKLVDICGNIDSATGEFMCDAMRLDRRPCESVIKEADNSTRLKETESFKKRFEEELQPLRELANRCMTLKIPVHPLEGVDKETWDRFIPEFVGARGEVVNAEGLSAELAAEVDGVQEAPLAGIQDFAPVVNGGGNATVVPDRPSWFKAGAKGGDDEDDEEWEETGDGAGAAKQTPFGTGALFGGGDADAYMSSYMAPGEEAAAVKVEDGAGGDAKKAETAKEGGEPAGDAELETGAPAPRAGVVKEAEMAAAPAAPESETVFVAVKGVKYALADITEDLANDMTPDEFDAYSAVRNIANDDDSDEDLEFD